MICPIRALYQICLMSGWTLHSRKAHCLIFMIQWLHMKNTGGEEIIDCDFITRHGKPVVKQLIDITLQNNGKICENHIPSPMYDDYGSLEIKTLNKYISCVLLHEKEIYSSILNDAKKYKY